MLRRTFFVCLIASLSACCPLDISFDSNGVSDDFGIINGVQGSYALGGTVVLRPSLEEGEPRIPRIEVTGTALQVESTSEVGSIVTATAGELGSGEIVLYLDEVEERRYDYTVSDVARITLHERLFDGGTRGFELSDGVFDGRFSLALGSDYGMLVRLEDESGEEIYGGGLLSADGGETTFNGIDGFSPDTSVAGASTVAFSAANATLTMDYEVVDALDTFTVERIDGDDTFSLRPRPVDAAGRPVYGAVSWTIDGNAYEDLGFGIAVFAADEVGASSHEVTASLLGMDASITADFVYP